MDDPALLDNLDGFSESFGDNLDEGVRPRKKQRGDEDEYEARSWKGGDSSRLPVWNPKTKTMVTPSTPLWKGETKPSEAKKKKMEEKTYLDEMEAQEVVQIEAASAKEHIAQVCSGVMEDLNRLSELRSVEHLVMNEEMGMQVRQLSLLSLVRVYKHILPGHVVSEALQNKEEKISQDVRHVRVQETTILAGYQRLLKLMTSIVATLSDTPLAVSAVRGASELIVHAWHFNLAPSLSQWLAELACGSQTKYPNGITLVAAQGLTGLFETDESGEASIAAVRTISKLVKARRYRIQPVVIDSFLSLRLDTVTVVPDKPQTRQKGHGRLERDRKKKTSAKKRARLHEQREVEKELARHTATRNIKDTERVQGQLLHHVFKTYFLVLKEAPPTSLLIDAVLNGLLNYTTLINIDLLHDLFATLSKLLDNAKIDTALLACDVALSLLSTPEGRLLNLDLHTFIMFLYRALGDVVQGNAHRLSHCIERALIGPKAQPRPRLLAFCKRIAMAALALSANPSACGDMLDLLTKLLHRSPSLCETLFEAESRCAVRFLSSNDPDIANGEGAVMWEMDVLGDHVDDTISSKARKIKTIH